ncbi:MAG: acyl-ACP--UDP-N-acetylglucosamine O-acyltransferase [Planctomycetota bacterium]|nr:acyl-ACP--UDP-N-acetylglucosamine O-acyltransferase [Planctomycetota bacterium]
MPKIHPTAIVDSNAKLADDVEVGPYCIVEADVKIGAGTVLRSHAVIRRYTTLGRRNLVDPFCVLGGEPQDYKFDPKTVSYLRIGDENIFREGVTISRATGQGNETHVGSRTYWMNNSHAGHNAAVSDEAVLAGGALVAGHATVGRGAILSGCVLIHQFTWVGERVMSRGGAAVGMHVPPYCLFTGANNISSLNSVGIRRNPDLTPADHKQIKEAFHITYRSGLKPTEALEKMDQYTDWGAAASKFREFLRRVVTAEPPYNRGLCPLVRYRKQI